VVIISNGRYSQITDHSEPHKFLTDFDTWFVSLTHCEDSDRSDPSRDCPNFRAINDFTVSRRPVDLYVYPPDSRRMKELAQEVVEESTLPKTEEECHDVTYKCVCDIHKPSDEKREAECDTGDEGKRGRDGNKGQPGKPGTDGVDGNPGSRGQRGKQGAVGEQGAKGQPGVDGSTGARGPTGETGPRGPAGERGPQGEAGDPGVGQPGRRGEKGPEGDQGSQGVRGQTGPQGATGPQVINSYTMTTFPERRHFTIDVKTYLK